MEKFDTIEKALNDKDIMMLREAFGSLCYAKMDLSDGVFEEQLRYVQSKINIKDDRLIGELIASGKTEFTLDDYADAVFELKENFCDERIEDVRTIGKALAVQRKKEQQEKDTVGTVPNPQSHREKEKSQWLPVAAIAVLIIVIFIILVTK
jgi:hypothetical protein